VGGADLWRPRQHRRPPGLVLVHGLTPEGKDDPRVSWAAALLARSGFAVLVPDLPAMRAQRLRPEDARVVSAAVAHLTTHPAAAPGPIVLVGVSVGVAPGLAAAVDPALSPRVRLVLSLGGYADARELIRYFTTGAYGYHGVGGRTHLDPGLVRTFLAANLDLVRDPGDRATLEAWLAGRPLPPTAGPEARAVLAVLTNQDPAQVDALLGALPAQTRALLDALSPARYVRQLRGRLLIVHGQADPAIPFTESLRLAAAADPRRTRLVLIGLLGHVEGQPPGWRRAWDLFRLWGVTYELLRG